MVFVDAQRYLKVQDEDLDDAFDDSHSHASRDDKYSKASFESFQIDPTTFATGQSKWRQYLFPIIVFGSIGLAVVAGLIVLIVFNFESNGDELGFDEDGNAMGEEVMAGAEYLVGNVAETVKRSMNGARGRSWKS
ncbi:protein of unknown function [Taphrina deformans PYCC 5710]|uniref:Uncharacterized protein n=1 Tax=Taphrina deformans (strain PYCC 5710 / ATCC 11124 / CBS 356.35 / IMI 108563 / JCM 9778 / NBRC 8474) TaxID=1097556 RepID=R4XK28_TAPDE|nr:protein of unknown function [Taphrina deformans PYCC 5710]|eukprot:CCG83668.1 protein of unknown function [Taphrina deformans PYCC 5710]